MCDRISAGDKWSLRHLTHMCIGLLQLNECAVAEALSPIYCHPKNIISPFLLLSQNKNKCIITHNMKWCNAATSLPLHLSLSIRGSGFDHHIKTFTQCDSQLFQNTRSRSSCGLLIPSSTLMLGFWWASSECCSLLAIEFCSGGSRCYPIPWLQSPTLRKERASTCSAPSLSPDRSLFFENLAGGCVFCVS